MLPFINREEEIKFLLDAYKSKDPELIIIYGRRRVGKTELITHFSTRHPRIYHLCSEDSERENINMLKERMAKFLKKSFFADLEITSWYSLFERFSEFLDNKTKTIIIIDEFPYLISMNRGVVSLFQKAWDEILSKKNIMMILSGSSINMMENEVLGYKSPLYGRRTGQWDLEPFTIKHVKYFFPDYDTENILKTYAVLGGVPLYLQKFDRAKPLFENINDAILTKGSFLYREAEFLLKQEFREQKTYLNILKKIGQGYTSLGKLCSAAGIEKANLSKYLYTLEDIRIIRHVLPLGMKRRGGYFIKDPYFNFYFHFVYPNISEIESGNREYVITRIKEQFPGYMGKVFEDICEDMLRKRFLDIPINSFEVRKWWHKDKEIDVAALNENTKEIAFFECKWKDLSRGETLKIIGELKEKAGYVKWNNDERKEYFGVIAKRVVGRDALRRDGYLVFDLRDF